MFMFLASRIKDHYSQEFYTTTHEIGIRDMAFLSPLFRLKSPCRLNFTVVKRARISTQAWKLR